MSEQKISIVVCGTPAQPNDPALGAAFDGAHCPKCGEEAQQGYGLAGGGMGVYYSCDGTEAKPCDFFVKYQDPEDK